MRAIEYLKLVRKAQQKLECKKKELEELRVNIAFSGGGSVGERVQASANGYVMEDKVIELLDMEEGVLDAIRRYAFIRDAVTDAILSLPKSNQIAVLHAKYVDGDRLEDIACYMHYNFDYVKKLHRKGIVSVERWMEENPEKVKKVAEISPFSVV